jgi:hypothetical protein
MELYIFTVTHLSITSCHLDAVRRQQAHVILT